MGSGFIYKLILALFLTSLAGNWNDHKEYFFNFMEHNTLLVLDACYKCRFERHVLFLKHKKWNKEGGKTDIEVDQEGGGGKNRNSA